MWWTQVGVVSKVSELVGKIVEIWMVVGVAGGCSSEAKQVAPMRKISLLVVDGWRGVESQQTKVRESTSPSHRLGSHDRIITASTAVA